MQQLNRRKPLPVRSTPTRAVDGQQAGAYVRSHYTRSEPKIQALDANLADQARRRADAAGVLWQCCKVASDPWGAAHWRRKQFAYRAILFELTRNRDGIAYENRASRNRPQEVAP